MTDPQTPMETVKAFVDAWQTGSVFTIESVHDEPEAVALVAFTSDGKRLLRRSHVSRVLDQIGFLDRRINQIDTERTEARDLARALYSALNEVAEGYAEIIGYDPRLDPDESLPFWLTGINGAPETWQSNDDPGDEDYES